MSINMYLTPDEVKLGSNFIILVGPPGSGKSSFAEEIKKTDDSWIVVSPDKIRESINGDASDQKNNVEVFKVVYQNLEDYLSDGYNVVYDATNCRAVYRVKILNAIKKYTNKCVCLVSSTSISECFERNAARNRVVPEDVIERMYFTLKKHQPTLSEGYDVIARF